MSMSATLIYELDANETNMIHKVIVVPGLGDETNIIKWVVSGWKRYDLEPIIHNIWWKTEPKHFEPKLKRLVNLIDRLSEDGNKISLLGASAGGSAVLNAFLRRKNKIRKVVSVCGRLRRGEEKGLRSFESRTSSSLAFKESVLMFEKDEQTLDKKDRNNIMTVRALFDELVPDNTAVVEGANNKQIKSIEHVFSIWMSLSFYKPLVDFLLDSQYSQF